MLHVPETDVTTLTGSSPWPSQGPKQARGQGPPMPASRLGRRPRPAPAPRAERGIDVAPLRLLRPSGMSPGLNHPPLPAISCGARDSANSSHRLSTGPAVRGLRRQLMPKARYLLRPTRRTASRRAPSDARAGAGGQAPPPPGGTAPPTHTAGSGGHALSGQRRSSVPVCESRTTFEMTPATKRRTK